MTITTTPWIPKKYLKALNAAIEMFITANYDYSEEEYDKIFTDECSDSFLTIAKVMLIDAVDKYGEDYVINLVDTLVERENCK